MSKDQKFFDQYPVGAMQGPILVKTPAKNGPVNQMLQAQMAQQDLPRVMPPNFLVGGLSSAEQREAVALAEAARLRHELAMAEQSIAVGGADVHRRNNERLWAEVQRLEQVERELRRTLNNDETRDSARARQLAADNEQLGHVLTGYQEALKAAWTILRAVSPTTFRNLDPGETLGDFASRLPPNTGRAVVAALHASLKDGAA